MFYCLIFVRGKKPNETTDRAGLMVKRTRTTLLIVAVIFFNGTTNGALSVRRTARFTFIYGCFFF